MIISIILVLKCSPTDEIMVTVDGGFKQMILFVKIKDKPHFLIKKIFLMAHAIQKFRMMMIRLLYYVEEACIYYSNSI